MRIRSANAERAHSSAARRSICLPVAQRRVHKKRAVLKIKFRIWFFEMQSRRQLAVPHAKSRMNQSRHTGRDIQMSQIRFRRSDRTELLVPRFRSKRLS